MPLIRVSGFSKADLVQDQPSHVLEPSAISGGKNFRFSGAKVQKARGYATVYGAVGMAPMFALSGKLGTAPWLLAAGLTKVFSLSSAVWADETGALSITASVDTGWSGDIMHGLGVLTNGVNNPFFFNGTTLATLTNWPPVEAGLTTCLCRSLRSYKNFLVAGYITENSVEYPQVVRWSHGADPGAVPSSWSATDETKDAGRKALSETPGYMIDSLTMGDVHMLYKNDSTFIMQYIGGAYIHRFQLLSAIAGMLSKNCAVDIGGAHVVLTQEDVVLITTQGIKSIANNRVRTALFNSLSQTYKNKSFVALHPTKAEVWICFSDGAEWPNKAYVWNFREDKWQIRDLPGLAYALATTQQNAALTIDGDSGTFDSDSGPIDSTYDALGQFVGLNYTGEILQAFEYGNTEGGTIMTSEIYHESYDFADIEGAGPERFKLITKLRPHVSPSTVAGTTLHITIGTQLELSDPISWATERDFIVGTTRDVYFRVNGRYISWKVSSDSDCHWELEGMDIDYRIGGLY